MRDLHEPLMRQGVDFWWVDGGSGAVDMPGLNKQLWTNKVFYDSTEQANRQARLHPRPLRRLGQRALPGVLHRRHLFASGRCSPTRSRTPRAAATCSCRTSATISAASTASKIAFDLYARWIEFGTFSPILRMHSAHENPDEGNLRMPWLYGDQGIALMRSTSRCVRSSFPTSTRTPGRRTPRLAAARAAAVPRLSATSRSPTVIRTSISSATRCWLRRCSMPSGDVDVYLPPGRWLDFFSGKRFTTAARTFTAHYAVDERRCSSATGRSSPSSRSATTPTPKPLDTLIVNVYGAAAGHFDLYEDDGVSLGYEQGEHAITPLRYSTDASGLHRLLIGPGARDLQGTAAATGLRAVHPRSQRARRRLGRWRGAAPHRPGMPRTRRRWSTCRPDR